MIFNVFGNLALVLLKSKHFAGGCTCSCKVTMQCTLYTFTTAIVLPVTASNIYYPSICFTCQYLCHSHFASKTSKSFISSCPVQFIPESLIWLWCHVATQSGYIQFLPGTKTSSNWYLVPGSWQLTCFGAVVPVSDWLSWDRCPMHCMIKYQVIYNPDEKPGNKVSTIAGLKIISVKLHCWTKP